MSCEHKTWNFADLDFELISAPGGPYAVFMFQCDECGKWGEFSNHIRNIIHAGEVHWLEP